MQQRLLLNSQPPGLRTLPLPTNRKEVHDWAGCPRPLEYVASRFLCEHGRHCAPKLPEQLILPLFLLMEKCSCIRPEVIPFLEGQVLARQHEYGEIGGTRMAPPFSEQLESAHLREHEIENYEFGQGSRHLGTGLRAVGRRAHDITMLGQHFGDELARGRIILDYQDRAPSSNLPMTIQ